MGEPVFFCLCRYLERFVSLNQSSATWWRLRTSQSSSAPSPAPDGGLTSPFLSIRMGFNMPNMNGSCGIGISKYSQLRIAQETWRFAKSARRAHSTCIAVFDCGRQDRNAISILPDAAIGSGNALLKTGLPPCPTEK